MGKFDTIDIIFISLISFYLLVFSLIFILLIRKHHGIRGLFRYLLDKNSITITNSGEVIEHIEEEKEVVNGTKEKDKDKTLSKKNKVTIKQFFEKRINSLKKDIAKDIAEELKNNEDKDVNEVIEDIIDTKKPETKNKSKTTATKKKTNSSKKKTNTKRKATNTKKKTSTKPKTTTKKTTNTKKKTNSTKKTTSKKK